MGLTKPIGFCFLMQISQYKVKNSRKNPKNINVIETFHIAPFISVCSILSKKKKESQESAIFLLGKKKAL